MSKIDTQIYLFDWGDTLMVDFADQLGKMCDWPKIAMVDGAAKTLAHLSKNSIIYIATGANDSTELDIKKAFERVNLNQYISGYFCQANLGVGKDSPLFFPRILEKIALEELALAKLVVSPAQITMVGDSLTRDVLPAINAGLNGIWLSTSNKVTDNDKIQVISSLSQLIKY